MSAGSSRKSSARNSVVFQTIEGGVSPKSNPLTSKTTQHTSADGDRAKSPANGETQDSSASPKARDSVSRPMLTHAKTGNYLLSTNRRASLHVPGGRNGRRPTAPSIMLTTQFQQLQNAANRVRKRSITIPDGPDDPNNPNMLNPDGSLILVESESRRGLIEGDPESASSSAPLLKAEPVRRISLSPIPDDESVLPTPSPSTFMHEIVKHYI